MALKGEAELAIDDAPWVEKYRPKTLDDVAAHKEIIDTSKLPNTTRWSDALFSSSPEHVILN